MIRSGARLPGLLVFAIAVLPHAFAIRLPFQLDDYGILAHLYRFAESGDLPSIKLYFFRPTAWVLWVLLMKLGGGLAHAPLFHATLLLVHGCVAWMLYRVLLPVVHVRSAFVAAGLFGLMPGAIEAVTWIAAGGDALALMFLLLAVLGAQRFARTGAAWTLPAVGFCAFASFLAKETMVAWLPAAALGLWSVTPDARRDRRWWRPAAAVVFGLAAGIVARRLNLGFWGPAYAYEVTLEADEVARFHKPLLQMLVPWNRAPEMAQVAPLTGEWVARLAGGPAGWLSDPVRAAWSVAIVTLGVPALLGVVRDPRTLPRVVAVLAAFALAFIPSLAAWRFGDVVTNTLSRTFYGPLAIACAAFALAIDPVMRPGGAVTRGLRFAALAFLAVFVALQIDMLVHVVRTHGLAAARVRSRLESIEEVARAELPGTHLVAVDAESGYGGLPLLGNGVAYALQRPFSLLDRRVWSWNHVVTLDRSPAFKEERGRIRVVEVRDARFVPMGEVVPALPAEQPLLASADGSPGAFAFPAPVAARAVAAIRFQGRPIGDTRPSCTWEGGGRKLDGPVSVPPGGAQGACLAAPPRPDGDAFGGLMLVDRVTIRGVDVAGTPEVVGMLPAIELRTPAADLTVVLGNLPKVTFAVPFDSPEYRVTFDFVVGPVRFPMVYTVPRSRLAAAGPATYEFVPRPDDRVEWPGHAYQVTWAGLPEAFRRELGKTTRAVAVQFRVQGIASDGMTPESESPWDMLTILSE